MTRTPRASLLEEALADGDRISGPDRIGQRNRRRGGNTVNHARQVDSPFRRAWREATRDRNGLLYRQTIDERILAGRGDFAENEEGPVSLDLDGNLGVAQIAAAQARFDGSRPAVVAPCAGTRPISGMEMWPAPSTE
jgi:hypothetical protein